MRTQNTKILYTYTARRSFVKNDLAVLKKHYRVSTYFFKTDIKVFTPLSFLFQALYILLLGWRYSVFVTFFAGYHSVIPALFSRWTGKKCIIFLGGTDCFKYPSFHYGNFTKKWYGRATCISAHHASLLVPVSENLINSYSSYYDLDPGQQGIYHWCAPLHTACQVNPLEFNPVFFSRQKAERKENSFITVAFGIEGSSYIRKGIDKVIMIADHFPQYTFTIVGCNEVDFPARIPENVTVVPPVPYEQLPGYYSVHQFYLQLSIAEGFPSAICEAMLCECIPIGSNVAAIPDIISTNGFIVQERKDSVILETVEQAIRHPAKEVLGMAARQHIIDRFGPGTRERELVKMFRSISGSEDI